MEKIAANLEDLTQEKVLISSGQQLLANMTGDIHRQLSQWPIIAHTHTHTHTEVASDMLGSQEENMKESQREILEDTSAVRENIHGVWDRIGERERECVCVCV